MAKVPLNVFQMLLNNPACSVCPEEAPLGRARVGEGQPAVRAQYHLLGWRSLPILARPKIWQVLYVARPTRAQQRRRQRSKDRVAKQGESGRQPVVQKLFQLAACKQQPAPPTIADDQADRCAWVWFWHAPRAWSP